MNIPSTKQIGTMRMMVLVSSVWLVILTSHCGACHGRPMTPIHTAVAVTPMLIIAERSASFDAPLSS